MFITTLLGSSLTASSVPSLVKILLRLVIGVMVLTIVLSVLPAWSLPPAFETAVVWLIQTLWAFDFVLPVNLMMTLFFYSLSIDVFFISIRLFLWVKEMLVSKSL